MSILRVYIEKNIGEDTLVIDTEVDDNIDEKEAAETARDVFFDECNYEWEIIKDKDIEKR